MCCKLDVHLDRGARRSQKPSTLNPELEYFRLSGGMIPVNLTASCIGSYANDRVNLLGLHSDGQGAGIFCYLATSLSTCHLYSHGGIS